MRAPSPLDRPTAWHASTGDEPPSRRPRSRCAEGGSQSRARRPGVILYGPRRRVCDVLDRDRLAPWEISVRRIAPLPPVARAGNCYPRPPDHGPPTPAGGAAGRDRSAPVATRSRPIGSGARRLEVRPRSAVQARAVAPTTRSRRSGRRGLEGAGAVAAGDEREGHVVACGRGARGRRGRGVSGARKLNSRAFDCRNRPQSLD